MVYNFDVLDHSSHDYCIWEMINFSRMGHARVLYAFLETPLEKRFQDGVLAADFGYPSQSILLPDEARERINKKLVPFLIQAFVSYK